MTRQYYIHDRTRGFVGNSMMWWRKNHCGYTCDIGDAHIFTHEEALQRICDAGDLSAYTVDSVRAYSEIHVTDREVLNPLVVTDDDKHD